jgi:hypothetical protein
MRILISIGYQKLLLGPKAGHEVLAALEGAVHVTEKGGWSGEPKRYVPDESEVDVTIVPDGSIALPENQQGSVMEAFANLSKRKDEAEEKAKKAEARVKELEATLKSIAEKSSQVEDEEIKL